jgi:hypothetical protein
MGLLLLVVFVAALVGLGVKAATAGALTVAALWDEHLSRRAGRGEGVPGAFIFTALLAGATAVITHNALAAEKRAK